MSREKEINEMVKDFPLKVKYDFLVERFDYVKIRYFLSYEEIEIDNDTVLLVEMGTKFLYGVLTFDKFYQVDSVDGEYVVVNVFDSVQWMGEWKKYM